MSNLVGNPGDLFSSDAALIILSLCHMAFSGLVHFYCHLF